MDFLFFFFPKPKESLGLNGISTGSPSICGIGRCYATRGRSSMSPFSQVAQRTLGIVVLRA